MRFKKTMALAASAAIAVTLAPLAQASAPDWDPEMDLGSGETVYVVEPAIQDGISSECLAAITKWRQDALDDGVKWNDRTGSQTMRQFLAAQGISEADYLNPQWSLDMEYIAIERALEAYTGIPGISHDRPNGDDSFSLFHNGERAWSESISWGKNTCAEAVDHWAEEKADWVNNTGKETGHYTYLINPSFGFYGLAGFLGSADSTIKGTNVWLGVASYRQLSDTSATNLSGLHTFPINLSDADIAQGAVLSENRVQVEKSISPTVVTKAHNGNFFLRGTFTSSDPAIAVVNADGSITGVAEGSVTLTFTSESGTVMTFPLSVWDREITKVAAPEAVQTPSGTAPELPTHVTATFDNGDVDTVPVTWEDVTAEQCTIREGGEFTVSGTVENWADPVHITVTVLPATVVSASHDNETVTVESGTAPTLDSQAQVSWSDGSESTEPIVWDEIDPADYSAREGGQFVVYGSVAGQGQAVHTTVNVNPASIISLEDFSGIEVIVGYPPSLPQTVKATWSNGDVTDEPVSWEEIPADLFAEPNEFEVLGTVAGFSDQVRLPITVKAVAITSIWLDTDEVNVTVGEVPTLPTHAVAAWNTGSVTEEPIVWDNPPTADAFAAPGDVVVTGHVEGFDGTVTMTYHVVEANDPDPDTDATGDKPGTPGKTPTPHDPSLPATGFANAGIALVALTMLGSGLVLTLRRRTA